MPEQLSKTPQSFADASHSDMQLVFKFLKVSSTNGLSGKELEDRLLTSLAIALHQNAPAH